MAQCEFEIKCGCEDFRELLSLVLIYLQLCLLKGTAQALKGYFPDGEGP